MAQSAVAVGRGDSLATVSSARLRRRWEGAFSWAAYPAVMVGAFGSYAAARVCGAAAQASGFLSAAVGVIVICALEARHPYRRTWRADRRALKTDFIYLIAVQVLLPMVLTLAASGALAAHGRHGGTLVTALWPRRWPLPVQFLLMLVIADGLKYALHAAAHRYPALWRLHAVHHQPTRLYALNVARFHPVERTLQYLVETLPFVVAGAGADVIALYLVFHSVHGFFQHANVDVRLGALNYVVSGPELHRWHHSRVPAESNANYANHLAIWDLVFGTYRRPTHRQVGALGLLDDDFPSGFAAQVAAPFRGAPDACRAALVNALMRLRMQVLSWRAWRPLLHAAADPRGTQEAVLRRIVAAQRETEFGRAHGFAAIATYDDYRRCVPVQSYESLRPFIETQERTGAPTLNAEAPRLYAQTSGTTGTPKYIPMPPRLLAEQQRTQKLASYLQYRAVPGAYDGRLLAIVSPAVEGHLPGGTPFGSASGHLYASMPRLARSKYVLPPEVFAIGDFELKYLLIVRLALSEPNITAMGAANPSTFLQLLATLRAHRDELLADVAAQRFSRIEALPPAVRSAIAGRLACAPARVAELRRLLAEPDVAFTELWPGLKLVTTWTGGSCGIALARVRAALPATTRIMELGYLASELRGSLTLDAERNLGLPTLQDTFFEFVETALWEADDPDFLTLDQLEVGRDYYVLITTAAGLYRYFMNDIVRVTGRFRATPTIAFVQKGKGVTSITGEKLYESQVIEAVRRAELEVGSSSAFFLALADVERAAYRLLIEVDAGFAPDAAAFAAGVDRHLRAANVEYAQKRASGRLAPVAVSLLGEGFGAAYKRWCVERGQREGQFKTIALQYATDMRFDYAAYVVGDSESADRSAASRPGCASRLRHYGEPSPSWAGVNLATDPAAAVTC